MQEYENKTHVDQTIDDEQVCVYFEFWLQNITCEYIIYGHSIESYSGQTFL